MRLVPRRVNKSSIRTSHFLRLELHLNCCKKISSRPFRDHWDQQSHHSENRESPTWTGFMRRLGHLPWDVDERRLICAIGWNLSGSRGGSEPFSGGRLSLSLLSSIMFDYCCTVKVELKRLCSDWNLECVENHKSAKESQKMLSSFLQRSNRHVAFIDHMDTVLTFYLSLPTTMKYYWNPLEPLKNPPNRLIQFSNIKTRFGRFQEMQRRWD